MMTRLFRTIVLGFIALGMINLVVQGHYTPNSLYYSLFRTEDVTWIPALAAFACAWILIDILLIHLWPEFCRIGDKFRFYPLLFALGVSFTTMYAGKEALVVWVHYGFTQFLICMCMLADAKYNNKKYCGMKGVLNDIEKD